MPADEFLRRLSEVDDVHELIERINAWVYGDWEVACGGWEL